MSRIHDAVILGTGHKPGLDHFRADGSLLTPGAQIQGLAPEKRFVSLERRPDPVLLRTRAHAARRIQPLALGLRSRRSEAADLAAVNSEVLA